MKAIAAPPDLTSGGVPADTISFNMGATGARGWVYHTRENTSESRQIQIKSVAAGSPADGILAANDVILGADGTGATPVNFTSDARKSLGLAIGEAEARNPATLKLIRWRAGVSTVVSITLQTMGAYSATAPYNCPKSTLILQQGLAAIMAGETTGRYSFGTLTLLAANNPADPNNAARMTRAQNEARALIPSSATMTQMMSEVRDTGSGWQRGHTLIVLAEYYLATGDTLVLPAIEAYAVNIARNQSMFGTLGHIYAEKYPDGSDNGPMGGQYGPVNSSGMPCFLGLLLARECGLNHPGFQPTTAVRVEAAIERTSRFFAYYTGRGSVPYGEHEAVWSSHDNNGKSGLAAICFTLQNNRVNEGKFFAKMSAASASFRGEGHTGAFFNYTWAPLGAACGGEEAAASHFSRIRWMLDLNRRWDGGFDYDCLTGEGPNSGSQYNDFRMSTAALLAYALPLRKLRITGKDHSNTRWLSSADVAAAAAVDGYAASSSQSISQLITDLGSWSPLVQRRAAEQLATRSIDTATLNQITALANDPNGTSRIGACYTLGTISNSGTANARAATLAALLTDPQNHVRFMAAEALRYLPDSAKLTQLNAILSAAASTGAPLLPFNEEDPLHFAHGRLAMLLFYSGNAYGPKGFLYGSKINSPTVIDRNLLYPAIRAVAANPIGQARSTLDQTYRNLTAADVNALADTLVDSIQFRAPSDKMFSAGIRNGGLFALERYNIADGVPLGKVYPLEDGRGDSYTSALGILKNYAGTCRTVTPDPDITGFCESLLGGGNAADAQAVLDAIAADTNPIPAVPFKSLQSATADAASLNLPANQTNLHASGSDLAKGNLIYTWRKVHGAGNATFTPNGTAAAKDTAIQFNNIPGKYLFEVKLSDSRGFTEVYKTVAVTLRNPDGTLPPNSPPTASPQAVYANPASVEPITLSGNDPEGYALIYSITSQPAHGELSGTAPNLSYTSDAGYIGADSFQFQVMDSEGQSSSATVTINVNSAGIELYAYDGFDYPLGSNILTPLNGGTGFLSAWARAQEGSNDSMTVVTGAPGSGATNTAVATPGNLDGVFNNTAVTTSPAGNGNRYIDGASGDDRITALRKLSQSAGALAGDDKVLWASAIWTVNGNDYGRHVGLTLGTDGLSTRSQNVSTNTSWGGSGAGMAIGVGGGINNSSQVTPAIWSGGSVLARTTLGAKALSNSQDNIVILKFVFADGANPDLVQAWAFAENENITEAVFTANAISAQAVVDQNALNILSFSQSQFGVEAIDEIRIGNSFAAVIGVQGPPPDTTPPTLVNIADNRGGEPLQQFTPVNYTVTFSEAMDSSTVSAADFTNAGIAACTIGMITQTLPGVFSVQVTPTTVGTLKLQVPSVAVLRDLSSNPLDTTQALQDDTVITVNAAMVVVPDVTGLPQAAAESDITSASLAVGAISQEYHPTVPTGSVINQTPGSGTSASAGSSVAMVISLGQQPDYDVWRAQYPGANLVDPSSDSDGDGINNENERIWGLNPTSSASANSYASPFNPQSGGFSYTRRNPALTGYAYTVWTSSDLSKWSEDAGAQQVPGSPDANGVQTVAVTLSPVTPGTGKLFVRVRATKTP
jgi:hypothetical protein